MEVIDKKNLQILQSKITTKEEFDYDTMYTRPLYSLLSQYDIDRLYNIATSIRYAGNAVKKQDAIHEIMHSRGFIEISKGTNRLCFGYLEDPSICVKVAADRTGIKDNPREFLNQAYLKPFCTKVYETTPCGTVGLFERVRPIQNREEFYSVADQIYELIDLITSKYILADFGTHFFMNYGFREFHNFGPVILDFPYLYEADARKLVCKKPIQYPDGHTEMCTGLIDYDLGFNNLICTKCGAKYRAVELAKYINENLILQKGNKSMIEGMKISLVRGDKVTKLYDDVMQDSKETINNNQPQKTGNKIIVRTVRVSEEQAAQEKLPQTSDIVRPTEKRESGMKVSTHRVPMTGKPAAKKDESRKNNKGNFNKDVKPYKNDKKTPVKFNDVKVDPSKVENKKEKIIDQPKKEAPKTVNVGEGWGVSEFDLEHHIIIFKSDKGDAVTVSTELFSEDILEMLVPNWETAKSAAEELELAKMDIRKLEEEIDKLKKSDAENVKLITDRTDLYNELEAEINKLQEENDKLKADNEENLKLLQDGTEVYDQAVEEKLALEARVAELESKLAEKDADYQASTEAYDQSEENLTKLEMEVADLKAKLEQVHKDYDELEAKSSQFETYTDKANAEIEKLKTQLAAYEEAGEVVSNTEEAASAENEEDDGEFGFSKLSGKLSTIGAVAKNSGMENIPEDCAETDHVIVFEDGQGGYFTDQFGNVIVVSDINGKLLADSELKIAKKKE